MALSPSPASLSMATHHAGAAFFPEPSLPCPQELSCFYITDGVTGNWGEVGPLGCVEGWGIPRGLGSSEHSLPPQAGPVWWISGAQQGGVSLEFLGRMSPLKSPGPRGGRGLILHLAVVSTQVTRDYCHCCCHHPATRVRVQERVPGRAVGLAWGVLGGRQPLGGRARLRLGGQLVPNTSVWWGWHCQTSVWR